MSKFIIFENAQIKQKICEIFERLQMATFNISNVKLLKGKGNQFKLTK